MNPQKEEQDGARVHHNLHCLVKWLCQMGWYGGVLLVAHQSGQNVEDLSGEPVLFDHFHINFHWGWVWQDVHAAPVQAVSISGKSTEKDTVQFWNPGPEQMAFKWLQRIVTCIILLKKHYFSPPAMSKNSPFGEARWFGHQPGHREVPWCLIWPWFSPKKIDSSHLSLFFAILVAFLLSHFLEGC